MTLSSSSVRPVVQAITLGIAATLALGACGSQLPGQGANAAHVLATPSVTGASAATGSAPVSTAVPSRTASGVRLIAATTVPSATHTVAPALTYLPLVEPFSSPGTCKQDGNTLEMTACVLHQVVAVDVSVDRLQRRRFEHAPSRAQQEADLRDDAHWLKDRTRTAASKPTGGTIDQILEAQTLLRISKQRVSFLASAE
jgi:uncharacterized protein YecT (DUF1311 family)